MRLRKSVSAACAWLFGSLIGIGKEFKGRWVPRDAVWALFLVVLAASLQFVMTTAARGASPGWNSESMAGTWSGTYVCGQGETGLTLTITGGPAGQINAVIDFFPIATTKIQIPPGSYSATGVIDSNGHLTLKPVAWINRPGNLAMLTYMGKLNDDSTVFEGIVPQCGFGKKFRATKSSSNEAASHAAGPGSTSTNGAVPDSGAKDEFSDPGQAGPGPASDEKVDPRAFTVAGVRLGMTRAEAIEAMKKVNPSMAVYQEWYAKNGVAESPFPGAFNPIVNLTPAEAKQKDNVALVSIRASSLTIAEEFLKVAHFDPIRAPKTVSMIEPGTAHVYILGKNGKKNFTELEALPKDATGLLGTTWAGCLGAAQVGSSSDALDLTLVFSPSETDPRVISVNFNQHFCDSSHEPTIESIRESLFKKFSRQVTFDPFNLPNPAPEIRAKLNYQIDRRYMMWRFDARNRVMDTDQAARMNLLFPRLTVRGGSVGLDAAIAADSGVRSSGAKGLEIMLLDQDKNYTWQKDLKKLGDAQTAKETERAKRGLSKDPNRTPF